MREKPLNQLQDDAATFDHFVTNDNCLIRVYLSKTIEDGDFVGFLRDPLHPSQSLDNLVLEVNCLVHINCVVCRCKIDTALSRNLQSIKNFSVFEVGLGWDTTFVQAGPAKF